MKAPAIAAAEGNRVSPPRVPTRRRATTTSAPVPDDRAPDAALTPGGR